MRYYRSCLLVGESYPEAVKSHIKLAREHLPKKKVAVILGGYAYGNGTEIIKLHDDFVDGIADVKATIDVRVQLNPDKSVVFRHLE